MTRYRIAILFSVSALIPLSIAYFLPIVKLENVEDGRITLLWIWGFLDYSTSMKFGLSFPFILFSISILVGVAYLFKSWYTLRKGNRKITTVSKDWIKIGLGIIGLEFGWILYLFPFCLFFIFWWPNFEFPLLLPLISGLMLILAGKLSMRLQLQEVKNANNAEIQ